MKPIEQRMSECQKDIEKVLKKHNLGIRPVVIPHIEFYDIKIEVEDKK